MTPTLAKNYFVAAWPEGRRESLEIKAKNEAAARRIVLKTCGPDDAKDVVIERDRRKFLGGSEVAAVLNLQPKGWRTAVDVYEDKIKPRSDLPPYTPPEKRKIFARGKRLEPHILKMLHEEHGIKVIARNNIYAHPDHDFLRAEIDFEWKVTRTVKRRYEWAEKLRLGSIQNGEIKSVHPFKVWEWGEAETDQVPVHYEAQAQHGLGLTGRKLALFGVLLGLDDCNLYPVWRDDASIAGIQQQCIDFWNKHVLAKVPPLPANMDDMMKLFAKANGVPVDATDEIAGKVRQLRVLRDGIKVDEGELERLEFAICDYMRDQLTFGKPDRVADDCVLMFEGFPIATWKKQSRESIDATKLAADRPDIVEAYSRTAHFRVLRTPKAK